jgi:hypothetical protein
VFDIRTGLSLLGRKKLRVVHFHNIGRTVQSMILKEAH